MVLPTFAREKLVVVTAGKKTVKGAQVDDWSEGATSERTIPNCQIVAATAEELADRSRSTSTDAIHALIDARHEPPTGVDRVRVPNGRVYSVQGEALQQPSLGGRPGDWRIFAERIVNRG